VDVEVFEYYGSTAPSGLLEEAELHPYVVDELAVEEDLGNACWAAKESRCFPSDLHGMVR
jgi:hypothetical protein